jgi:hypothetical protein
VRFSGRFFALGTGQVTQIKQHPNISFFFVLIKIHIIKRAVMEQLHKYPKIWFCQGNTTANIQKL